MVVSQTHYEFNVLLDKVDTLSTPNFEPEERDVFLNNAVERYISQRAYGTNPKGEGLEETQKRLDDLKNITSNSNITTFTSTTDNKPNGYFVQLPSDYRHAIGEEVSITYTDCNSESQSKRIPVIPVTHDRYNRVINDPFSKPCEDEIIRLGYGADANGNQRFELITDGSMTLTTYHLRYIKEPQKIQYGTVYDPSSSGFGTDQDGSLMDDDYRAKEIIKMAITEALGNIESQRVLLSEKELEKIE